MLAYLSPFLRYKFFCLSHLVLSLRVTYFELMEKLYEFIMSETVVQFCNFRFNIP